MSTPTTAVIKTEEKPMEFVPFGAEDKIKLTIAIVKNLIAVKTKTGKTCNDNEAIKFMMMCQARRLNPFEGDAFLIGYDGKDGPQFSLITAHQAFLKRAELNSEYDGMKSGIIVQRGDEQKDLEGDFFLEGDVLLGGWATVYFKNRKQPMHKRVRLQRFKKSWGIWVEDPAGMICKCAEADALRSSFPTMLGGLYLREEMQATEPKLSTPIFTSAPATIFTPKTPSALPEGVQTPPTQTKDATAPSSAAPGPIEMQASEVRELCSKAGITEAQVVDFCQDIGLCDGSSATLEQIFTENDTAAGMIIEQWEDISTRIKENK